MTVEREGGKRCPLCGGRLEAGRATIPFVFAESAILVKGVPAEICQSCHEPFVAGTETDTIVAMLDQLRSLRLEMSVASFPGVAAASPATASGEAPS
jgi:YgiT-type zinc finger domain-containing protein